ncbi:MAG: CBS domain-containing protein [Candidatus Lokiarchaeota archaeon]|nr:CBS domain-containing protein [Candidatus Lokiarchaeota archaeon]
MVQILNFKFKSLLKKMNEKFIHNIYEHKMLLMFLLSILIGVISGFGAIFFRYLIFFNHLLFNLIPFYLGATFIMLPPVIGGLIVGLLTNRLGKETKGHGVPEIMESMALKGGRINKRVALLKMLVSSITIGSGGSAGREGPIAQIGASAGSTIGQVSKLDENNIKILVACGVSSGIAATFNAPFGGLLFGIEVILSMTRLNAKILINLIMSIVIANLISILFLGNHPAFFIQTVFWFNGPFDFILYALLGIILGFLGIFFVKFFYFIEDIFDKIKIPNYLKPALGGLGVGLIALFFSQSIMGVGYETIELTLGLGIPVFTLLLLGLFKIFATSLTVGSGGSGGIFAPSLFIGATFGGCIGFLFYFLFPGQVSYPMAFALVGMGALFAGVARAPLTCIIMTVEMTSDYLLIIPLMISCVLSYLINSLIMKEENIYTLKLLRRGVRIKYNYYTDLYDDIEVSEVMNKNVATIDEEMPIFELLEKIEMEQHMGYPVLNKEKELIGIVAFSDVRKAILDGNKEILAKDLCKRKLISSFPDETIHDIMIKMLKHDIGRLPVVDRRNPKKILGIITRSDIVKAHELESIKAKLLESDEEKDK